MLTKDVVSFEQPSPDSWLKLGNYNLGVVMEIVLQEVKWKAWHEYYFCLLFFFNLKESLPYLL